MTTEKQLIAVSDVYSLFRSNGTASLHVVDIDLIPRVDAVEVVHGRWEDVYCGRRELPRFQCSVCKEFALRKSERDWLGILHESQALTRYCPYCGAELKGDKDE